MKKKKLDCKNPCKDFIMGGCGSCPPECHQPPEYYEKKNRKVVVVSGGFDPLHIGHVRMFREAKKLGNYLVVVMNNDNWLRDKKGFVFMPEKERAEILRGLDCVDEVVITSHTSGCSDKSVSFELAAIKPKIFANGGDRRSAKDIPEATICRELGIKMAFNVGKGGKVQSSSWLTDKAACKSVKTPWGHMETYRTEKDWWLKTLTLMPNQAISLQKHHKRGETWVCVEGTLRMEFRLTPTGKANIQDLKRGQTHHIGKGVIHRIWNVSDKPATLVEIADGAAFEEDIVRYEDLYDRA